jgi:hypothetical protein
MFLIKLERKIMLHDQTSLFGFCFAVTLIIIQDHEKINIFYKVDHLNLFMTWSNLQ